MNDTENLTLQGLQLSIDRLSLEIAKQRQEAESRGRYDGLPEWIDLEQAVALKRGVCAEKKRAESGTVKTAPAAGGASLITYRQKLFLQPCCGLNYRLVAGRRVWKKEDVIAWLSITDEDLLAYAESRGISLPKVYEDRALKNAV
ncbi:MAG: hypothetical protein LBP37_04045 [Spirochaetaceae bacterium]|jgi:hypothetical protein|nr:hypothetical protein [Spirochaetaceae bacterium]